ncbi:MAG: hypothetical protein AAGA48_06465 [Myxococcota bacterium]
MTTAAPLWLYLTALPSFGSIFIGHPVPALIEPHPSVRYLAAEVDVDRLELVDCNGNHVTKPVSSRVDLLSPDNIHVPQGDWCTATMVLGGPIEVSGDDPVNGGQFSLKIGVGAIFLDLPAMVSIYQPPQTTAATTFKLGSPGWITSAMLALGPGKTVVVDAVHPLHDQLRDSLRFTSRWE